MHACVHNVYDYLFPTAYIQQYLPIVRMQHIMNLAEMDVLKLLLQVTSE